MPERETDFSPEAKPLRDNERLLFISPQFARQISHHIGREAVYRQFVAPRIDLIPFAFEGPPTKSQEVRLAAAEVYIETDPNAGRVYEETASDVLAEYFYTLTSLIEIVGPDKITITSRNRSSVDELTHIDDICQTMNLTGDLRAFSFDYPDARTRIAYPRDKATHLEPYTFLTTRCLPNLTDDEDIKRLPVAEGGSVLIAGNSILMAEFSRKRDSTAQKGYELLQKMGYRVAWYPECDPEKQPKGKRGIVEGHIDDHSALIVGRDDETYLLVGSSFLRQDVEATRKKVNRASDRVGARLVEIDDSNLPHLAFNFIQFRDGSVALSSTGSVIDGEYRQSGLELCLEEIVGKDRVRLLPPLTLIPPRTGAGLRCMTNILPVQFLHKARTATGQI